MRNFDTAQPRMIAAAEPMRVKSGSSADIAEPRLRDSLREYEIIGRGQLDVRFLAFDRGNFQPRALRKREIIRHCFAGKAPMRGKNFVEAKSLRGLRPIKLVARNKLVAFSAFAPERVRDRKERRHGIGVIERTDNARYELARNKGPSAIVNEHASLGAQPVGGSFLQRRQPRAYRVLAPWTAENKEKRAHSHDVLQRIFGLVYVVFVGHHDDRLSLGGECLYSPAEHRLSAERPILLGDISSRALST